MCPRCHGFLVHEHAYDLANSSAVRARLLRCVNCGARLNPVICRNRGLARSADESRLLQEAEQIAQGVHVGT